MAHLEKYSRSQLGRPEDATPGRKTQNSSIKFGNEEIGFHLNYNLHERKRWTFWLWFCKKSAMEFLQASATSINWVVVGLLRYQLNVARGLTNNWSLSRLSRQKRYESLYSWGRTSTWTNNHVHHKNCSSHLWRKEKQTVILPGWSNGSKILSQDLSGGGLVGFDVRCVWKQRERWALA